MTNEIELAWLGRKLRESEKILAELKDMNSPNDIIATAESCVSEMRAEYESAWGTLCQLLGSFKPLTNELVEPWKIVKNKHDELLALRHEATTGIRQG